MKKHNEHGIFDCWKFTPLEFLIDSFKPCLHRMRIDRPTLHFRYPLQSYVQSYQILLLLSFCMFFYKSGKFYGVWSSTNLEYTLSKKRAHKQ